LRNRKVSFKFVTIGFLTPKMRRDVFQAIADPTRREIINMVANHAMNLNTVAEKFEMSRPAISKHIKILTQCGLVTIRQQGRERFCEAKLEKLGEVFDWIEQYKVFWTKKLDALSLFLEQQTPPVEKKKPVKKTKEK
jgi:DNA-binding transcriptional ArsR family regulator